MKQFLQIGILLLGGLFAFLGGEAQVKHSLTIRVKARTEVTGQPVAASKVCELSPLTLGVKVTGEGAVAYRWLKKTGAATYTEIPGATSDTLRIVSASLADAGDYVCEVTGECNADTSAVVNVVIDALPTITSLEAKRNPICERDTLLLTVTATGTPVTDGGALTYKWSLNGVDKSTAGPVYRAEGVTDADNGKYSCTVVDKCGTASQEIDVVVDPAPTLSFPSDLDICSSAPHDVDLTFTGTAPFTYRITGDTEDRTAAASLSTITLSPSVTTTYRLVSLTDGNGCRALKVEGGELAGPVGDIAPGVPFTVRSLSGAEVKTRSRILYSWTVNGTAVEGSGDTLTYTATEGGEHHFVRTAQIGELESSVAEMTVCVAAISSAGSISYSGGEVCTGAAFSISNGGSATSTCGAAITYEWFRNNVSIGNNAVTLAQSGLVDGTYTYYRKAKLSNGQSANSSSISVTVKYCGPPTISAGKNEWTAGDMCTSCTWQQAKDRCVSLGMRLPNDSDWGALPKNSNVLGLPDGPDYWSATEDDSVNANYWYWVSSGLSGPRYGRGKVCPLRVRCVRN